MALQALGWFEDLSAVVGLVEVFTLPQVFLVDPCGMTWNPCRFTQIPSREWNSLSLVFWPLQSTWIHADPHGL
jgi:hypothetical protein